MRILPLIFFVGFVMQLDVQVFAFASNGFIDALNISEAEYGIVVTTNFIAQTAFLYPSAIFAKQIGLRVYLTTVMTLQGCILALTPLVNSFASLLAVRGVLGIIQSALMPSMTGRCTCDLIVFVLT